MRVYIAGFITAVTFVVLYFLVPSMKHQYEGFGTELPKSVEILIAVSDTFVNYFYILLPVLFFSLIGLSNLAGKRKDDREGQ